MEYEVFVWHDVTYVPLPRGQDEHWAHEFTALHLTIHGTAVTEFNPAPGTYQACFAVVRQVTHTVTHMSCDLCHTSCTMQCD